MLRILITTIILTMCSYTYAGSVSINTGKSLLSACTETLNVLNGQTLANESSKACLHFLFGFDSGQSVATLVNETPALYCPPGGNVVMGDMVTALVGALESNRNLLETPAGIAAWQALAKTWPCK